MKGEHQSHSEVIFYQTDDGKNRLQVRFSGETAWLSLNQLAELFQRDNSVISKHIKNIFEEGNSGLRQLLQNLQQFKRRAFGRLLERSNAITST